MEAYQGLETYCRILQQFALLLQRVLRLTIGFGSVRAVNRKDSRDVTDPPKLRRRDAKRYNRMVKYPFPYAMAGWYCTCRRYFAV